MEVRAGKWEWVFMCKTPLAREYRCKGFKLPPASDYPPVARNWLQATGEVI